MKILMLCEYFGTKVEYQENLFTRYYRKLGHDVMVLTSTYESVHDFIGNAPPPRLEEKLDYEGAIIWRLKYKFNILGKIRPLANIGKYLNEFKPNLIYVHDISANFAELSRYVRNNPGCQMIMDYHADYSNSGKNWLSLKILHGVVRRYYLNRARPYLAKIFPVVPASAAFLNEVYSVPFDKMELLPLGADLDLIDSIRNSINITRKRAEFGIGQDDFVIITGGKITPMKRLELLVQAMQHYELRDARLLVVGDFPETEIDYKKHIESLSKSMCRRIQFLGWQDQESVFRLMCISDLAVFPASQSVMWQHAIACGLPLVCGDIGGQDVSYLNANGNIIILKGKEIGQEQLSRTIMHLVNNRSILATMAIGAKSVARQELDPVALLGKTLRFCD